jgi:hypothetical protein
MMISERRESWSRQIRKHRNVYRFGGVWAQTLLAAVPWVNAVILVVLLMAVHGQLTVTPGVAFDLPRAPLREGARSSLDRAHDCGVARYVRRRRNTHFF